MADSNVARIHLVEPSPKALPRGTAEDVAAETMATVRDCMELLHVLNAEHDALVARVFAHLENLQCAALRAQIEAQKKVGQ